VRQSETVINYPEISAKEKAAMQPSDELKNLVLQNYEKKPLAKFLRLLEARIRTRRARPS
jgi:hypothetical protein